MKAASRLALRKPRCSAWSHLSAHAEVSLLQLWPSLPHSAPSLPLVLPSRSPVLDALQSYKVQVTPAGDIYVDVPAGKPVTKGRVPHMCKQSAAADQRHFVIIGAGPAAATAVETMRSEGFQGRITIIAKERALPYDRTKLSKNMAVGADEVALRKPEFYPDALGCEVRLGATVTSVDPSTKTVILEGGERIAYDKLLCASGGPARTFRKPEGFVIPGAESGRIFPLRDSGHSAGIEKTVDALGKDLAVVIVGSSFIGMGEYLGTTAGSRLWRDACICHTTG